MSRRQWNRERVVEAIRDWHRRGTPLAKIWRKDWLLCAAAYRHFESWRDALAAAGLRSVREQWSKERVIRELQDRYPCGFPRSRRGKQDTRLKAAAARYFGGWHQALLAAGLRRGEPRTLRTWTPPEVIKAIQVRHHQGLSLTTVWQEDKKLYAVAKRTFGSWRQALRTAGFDCWAPTEWTGFDVIQEIHTRRDQDLPLVAIWRDDPQLYSAAKKHFGNWHKALLAAGLESKPRQSWTKQSVLDAIRLRHQQDTRLSRVWKEDKPLFRAAVRNFGNWQKALQAAGLEFKPRRKWSEERVVQVLRAWHRQSNANLRELDPTVVGAAIRFLGSLDKALEVAGIEPDRRRWTKRRVVKMIQDRYVRGACLDVAGFNDKRLATAAKRYFGTWRNAVATAGLASHLPPPKIVRVWTADAVLKAIQAWYQQGRPVTNVSKQDQGLYCAAKKHFGGWRNAVLAAGLVPARKCWTKQLVIQEIRARHNRGLALTSIVFKEDGALAGAAFRLFGSWRNALLAAGIEPAIATGSTAATHFKGTPHDTGRRDPPNRGA